MTVSFKAFLLTVISLTSINMIMTSESVETQFCQNTTAEVSATSNEDKILLSLIIDTDPPHADVSQISFSPLLYTEFFHCITNHVNSICSAHYHNTSVTKIDSSVVPSLNFSTRAQKFLCLLNTTMTILECSRQYYSLPGKNLFMMIKENQPANITYSPLVALAQHQAIVSVMCVEEYEISCDCFADVIDEYYFSSRPGNHHNAAVRTTTEAICITLLALFSALSTL